MNFLIRGLDLLEYFLGCKLSHRQNFPFCVFCYHKVWTKIAYNFQISAYDYMKNGLTAHTGVYMAIHDRQRTPMMHEEAILLSLNTGGDLLDMVRHEMTMFGNDLMIQFTFGHSYELCRHISELYLIIPPIRTLC